MEKRSKTFLFAAVVLFLCFSFSSCGYMNIFQYHAHFEDTGRNYLVKYDGTKIYGDSITWSSVLGKGSISIDGQKYNMKEVRGYFQQGIFYGHLRGGYILRIIHGKINIYRKSKDAPTSTGTIETYFVQRGEDGEMQSFDLNKITDYVKDCPLAVKMASERHKHKMEPNYLTNIFEVYNNDCKN